MILHAHNSKKWKLTSSQWLAGDEARDTGRRGFQIALKENESSHCLDLGDSKTSDCRIYAQLTVPQLNFNKAVQKEEGWEEAALASWRTSDPPQLSRLRKVWGLAVQSTESICSAVWGFMTNSTAPLRFHIPQGQRPCFLYQVCPIEEEGSDKDEIAANL